MSPPLVASQRADCPENILTVFILHILYDLQDPCASAVVTRTLLPGVRTCFKSQRLQTRKRRELSNTADKPSKETRVSTQRRTSSKPLHTRKQLSIIILPNLVYSPL